MSDWWNRLTYQEQVDYLENHPRSKNKITKKKGRKKKAAPVEEEPKAVEEEKVPDLEKIEKPAPSTVRKVIDYVKANPGKVALAIGSTLISSRRRYDKNIDGMPVEQRNNFANALRTAIAIKDSKALAHLSARLGIQMGVVLVGATALSLLTGVNLSMAVPLLATNFWQQIKDSPDNVEYLKNAGEAYVKKVRENLDDPEMVKKSIVKAKPDIEVDLDQPEKACAESTHVAIASTHESDLNKALVKLEKLFPEGHLVKNVEAASTYASKVTLLLEKIQGMEKAIPTAATVMVAALPQKQGLVGRAKDLITRLNQDLAFGRAKLNELAESNKTGIRKSPVKQMLEKAYSGKPVTRELSYVLGAGNKPQLCEVHTVKQLEVAEVKYNALRVYVFPEDKTLQVAASLDSMHIPKSFTSVRPKNVVDWLQDAGYC